MQELEAFLQDPPEQDAQPKRSDLDLFLNGPAPSTLPASPAIRLGQEKDADRSTRVMRLAQDMKLPEAFVNDRLEAVEAASRKRDFDLNQFRLGPVVKEWMATSPYTAGTVLGDKDQVERMAALGKLESLLTLPPSQWPRTKAALMAAAKRRADYHFDPKREEEAKAKRIEHIQQRQREGEHGVAAVLIESEKQKAELDKKYPRSDADKKAAKEAWLNHTYEKLWNNERYISGDGQEGLGEFLSRKLGNYHELMPFGGDIPEEVQTIAVMEAAVAVEEKRATPEDIDLLEDYGRMAEAQERRGRVWYARAADITLGSSKFIAEMALTGGVYSGVKGGVSKGLTKLLAEGGKDAIEGMLRRSTAAVLSRGAGVAAQSALMAAPALAGKTEARTLKGEDAVTAYGEELLGQMIEVGSERLSGPLGKVFGFATSKLGATEARGLLKSAIETAVTGTKKLEAIHVGGIATEFLEERAADILRSTLLGEKYAGVLGADPVAELAAFAFQPLATAPIAAIMPKPRVPDMSKIEMNKDAWNAVGESLKDTPLLKNAPDQAEKLVERMTTGDATVPFVDFKEFYQAKGEDPRAKAASLGILDRYEDSVESGADLVIPRAKAVTKIAATDDGKSFADIISWTPTEMSKKQADEYLKDHPPPEAGESKPDQVQESADALESSIADTLVKDAKFRPDQAASYATQIAAFYRVQGLRGPKKLSAQEMFVQFPILFQRGGFETGGFEQIPVDVARKIPIQTQLPHGEDRAQFDEAVKGTPSAKLVEDGLQINLARFQKEEQAGAPSVRTGVFYLPEGSPQAKYYRTGKYGYGGTQKVEGETLIKRPLFVKGATGGKAPENAYDKIKGKGAFEKMRTDILNRLVSNRTFNRDAPSLAEDVYEVLEQYGGDTDLADLIADTSNQGNRLAYAVQEHIVAHAVRAAGYDAVVGWSKGKSGPFISEVFDVREVAYPSPEGDYELHEQFQGGFNQPSATAEAPRGTYTPAEAGKPAKATLKKDANLSTLIHEMGHHYLEVFFKLAGTQDATERLIGDAQTTLDWFGVKDLATWNAMSEDEKRPHHEKWARANERYWMEGKAPSSALKRVFDKFKSWLVWLYKTPKALNVEITPEMRSVLDRLWATEEEIAATHEEMNQDQTIYSTPEKYGMTPGQADRELGAVLDSQAAFDEEMRAKMLDDIKREDDKEWKEELEKIKAEVRAEVNKEPVQIAYYAFHDGTQPDGSPLPDGITKLKLARADVRKDYGGQEVVNSFPPGVLVDHMKGTIYPDAAAEQFGFTSGQALVRALVNMEMREHKVERLARQKMLDLHPTFFDDQDARAEAAMEAFHNEKRATVLRKQLEWLVSEEFAKFKGLVRRITRRIPSDDQVKADAESAIQGQKVRSIHPEVYKRAESRAAKQAVESMLKGDWDAAFDAKLQELVSYERFRAASKAKQDVKKSVAWTQKFKSEGVQRKLGRAGYLEQINGILSRFGLSPKQTAAEKATRKTVEAFIKEKQAEGDTFGEEIYADAIVLNESVEADYRNLTYGEFSGLIDTVKHMDHVATELNNYRIQEERIDFTEKKQELIAAIRSNVPGRPPPPLSLAGEGTWDKAKKAGRSIDAALIKTEQIAQWIDAKNVNGPFHKLIWEPIVDAQSAYYDLTKEISAVIARHMAKMPATMQAHLMDKIDMPGAPYPVTRADALGMFWSLGTYSNQQKTERGEAGRLHNLHVIGLTPAQMRYAVDQLTKEEADFGQGMLDTLESLWPKVEALQKRVTGIPPTKLVAQKIVTTHGTYRGGYFPMMYDKRFSKQMGLEFSDDIGGLLEKGYTRATTPQSHTKDRAEAFAAPVDFGALFRLPQHIAGVIKDLTHREAVFSINKMLLDPDVRNVIDSTLGPEYHKRLMEWLKQTVNDRNFVDLGSMNFFNRGVERLRLNATIASMGLKASVMASQTAGLAAAAEVVGPDNLRRGIQHVLKNPRKAHREAFAESGELRHRQSTYEHSISTHFQRLEGNNSALANSQRVVMYGIGIADMMVSLPAYYAGKFEQEGKTPDDPVAIRRAGDRAVRLSQGSGGAKDLAAVVASRNSLTRLGTMFYSWASAAYGRFRDIGRDAKRLATGEDKASLEKVAWLTARLVFLWPVSASIAAYTSGVRPKDDEDWTDWFVKVVGVYPLLTLPFVRDVANPVFTGYDYQLSPVERAGKLVVETARDIRKEKRSLEEVGKDMLDLSGYIFGLPTSQLAITGEYMKDWIEGDVEPESLDEVLYDFLYRRPRERNRD